MRQDVPPSRANTDPPPRPRLVTGDCVYYRHPETGDPHHGEVAAIGEHGFLVDADGGGEHRVLWDRYLGHRKRKDQRYRVVDRGEDGLLVEDESGKRLYVHGHRGEEMTKSMAVAGQESSLADLFMALSARVVELERHVRSAE